MRTNHSSLTSNPTHTRPHTCSRTRTDTHNPWIHSCRGVLGRIWVEANRALLVKEGQGRHARRASDFRRNQSNHAAEVDAHAAEVESLRLEKEDFLRQKKEMEDMKKEMEDFQRQRKEMEGNAAP